MMILENQPSAVVTQALLAAALALMTGNLVLGLFALLTGLSAIVLYQRSHRRTELLGVGALVGLTGAALIVALELTRGGFEGLPRLLGGGGERVRRRTALGAARHPPASALRGGLRADQRDASDGTVTARPPRVAKVGAERARYLSAQRDGGDALPVGRRRDRGERGPFCATAALYHDIGKLHRAGYFVENIRRRDPARSADAGKERRNHQETCDRGDRDGRAAEPSPRTSWM